jgi:hypothetical protein
MRAREALFEGVKASPAAADAWQSLVETWPEPLDDYPLTCGQQSSECEALGHLLRVYRIEGMAVWFDHDDVIEVACLEVPYGGPDVLRRLDAWRLALHAGRDNPLDS